jgi:hypothetical protein
MLWLPEATRDPHGRTLTWSSHRNPKGCLHTTETLGWPTYQSWTVHPHATVKPIPGKGVEIRQHVPFDQASFSLRNLPGGVETNRDYVFQFELIGTCDRGGQPFKAGAYYWPDADNAVLLDLHRKVIAPLSRAYDIPIHAPVFQAYPGSAGARDAPSNAVRMRGASFDDYTGWLGHQHVPENVHGDPGAFPWNRMNAMHAASQEDILATKAELRAEIIDVLKTEKLVPNKPTAAQLAENPNTPTTFFTIVGALSNIEGDDDNRNTAINQKLDAILGAVKALTPPA